MIRCAREPRRSRPARREFLRWLAASPLFALTPTACRTPARPRPGAAGDLVNLLRFEDAARAVLSREEFDFLAGGADDEVTLRANREAFGSVHVRARRLRANVDRLDPLPRTSPINPRAPEP